MQREPISYRTLAAKINTPRSTIERWLNGHRVPDWSLVEPFVDACYSYWGRHLTEVERADWMRRRNEAQDFEDKNTPEPSGPTTSSALNVDHATSPEPPPKIVSLPRPPARVVALAVATAGVVIIAVLIIGTMVSPRSDGNGLPSYEGNVIQASSGGIYWIKNGQKRYVPGETILKCLQGRAGVGEVISVSAQAISAYPSGSDAYCPYEQEPGLNFVQEGDTYDPSRAVWLVGIDSKGIPYKRLVRRLCGDDPEGPNVPPQYHVGMIPVGETTGRYQGPDFWGDDGGPICQALPKPSG